jgi:aryl-alcohol dehydrogenase-like predicted oxidoreductase
VQPRPLGRTGLEVTPLGLGLAALGRPGYLNLGHGADLPADRSVERLRDHAHAVLDRAVSRGIRYVDVARSYGRGEEFLADWLRSRPDGAEGLTIGSKWGYTYTAGWQVDAEEHEVKDHSPATFRRQLGETRERLDRHLDLYQVHSATLDSGVLTDGEVLTGLTELARAGVAVGLTLSGRDQAATLHRALELTAAGHAPFACVQATWNLLESYVAPALAAAHAAGWGVIVKEAVANGRLTPRGDAPAALHALAREHGVGLDALAIAAALAQPFTSVVLSGAATVEQLDANVAALDVDLDEATLASLTRHAEPADRYWARRSHLPWT